MANLTNVMIDGLGTPVLYPQPGQAPVVDNAQLTWSQDRWLIGWDPWYGFGQHAQVEADLQLMVQTSPSGPFQKIFQRGPHKEGNPQTKEADNQMYDSCRAEFFPTGYGVFVPAGSTVLLQFLDSDTGSLTTPTGGQANAIIYSVPAG